MKEKIKQMVLETKQDLVDLDENELQARVELHDAQKKYEKCRVDRELKLQKLRLLLDAVMDD